MDERAKLAVQTALETSKLFATTAIGFAAAAVAIAKLSDVQLDWWGSLALYITTGGFLLSCLFAGAVAAKLTGAVAREETLSKETIYDGFVRGVAGAQAVTWFIAMLAFIAVAMIALT